MVEQGSVGQLWSWWVLAFANAGKPGNIQAPQKGVAARYLSGVDVVRTFYAGGLPRTMHAAFRNVSTATNEFRSHPPIAYQVSQQLPTHHQFFQDALAREVLPRDASR